MCILQIKSIVLILICIGVIDLTRDIKDLLPNNWVADTDDFSALDTHI